MLLKSVDVYLSEMFPGELPILDLNIVTFGAAVFIQKKHVPWYDEKRNRTGRKKKSIVQLERPRSP